MSLIDWSNYFKDGAPKFPKRSTEISYCSKRDAPYAPASPVKMDECERDNDTKKCREWFEEHAAIIEFDGGLSRKEAERLAIVELCSMMEECLKLAT